MGFNLRRTTYPLDQNSASTDLADLVPEFIEHCEYDRNYSELTCINYRNDLRKLTAFLNGQGVRTPQDIHTQHLLAWLESKRNYRASTKRRKLSTFRTFFKYLTMRGAMDEDPTLEIQRPKIERSLPKWIPAEHIQKMLKATHDVKERTMLLTLVLTGVRRAELADLDVADVDLEAGTLLVRGKGNKERLITICPRLREALRDYLANARRANSHPALFLNRHGRRFTVWPLNHLFRRWVRDAGLEAFGWTPRHCRHAFCTLGLRAGVDIGTMRDLMGHDSVATTNWYAHSDLKSCAAATQRVEQYVFAAQAGAI